MRVTYINRDKRKGNFSIERIFHAVQKKLENELEIENYYLPSIRKKLKGVLEVSKLYSDIFHITGDVNFLSFGVPSNKLVITIHDLGYFENPVNRGVKRFVYKYIWLKYPLERAAAITTISEFTKSKLIKYFPIKEDKITVIPNPVFQDFKQIREKFIAHKPVILQIGTGPHKNLIGLIEAVKNMNVKVSIVGNPGAKERLMLEKYQIEHEIVFNISDEKLKEKYAEADILYFVSFYEGFGVPIIEANQLGIPVITSNRGPMPWVARNAAVVVDPENIGEIKDALCRIMHEEVFRSKLIHEGFENVKRFDLDVISRQYLNIYKKVFFKNA